MTINIDAKELLEILAMTPAEQNIMLAGAHGIGKSRILTDYFESKGVPVITLFLGQMSDPGDLIGLPNKNEKTGNTEFLPPYWFPTDNQPIVLFLDEVNRARPEISDVFSRYFMGSSNEHGALFISNNENKLEIAVKLERIPTIGGNFVDINIKDVGLDTFVDLMPELANIVEKFDGWEGVKGEVHLELRKHRGKLRCDVYLTEVYEAPKNLLVIDCINSMHIYCFKKCRGCIESAYLPRKLLFDADSFDGCRSHKVIHII